MNNEIYDIEARYVECGVHEVFSTTKQQFVPVKHVVVSEPTERFIRIKKDTLGENKPTEDLYITSGHVLMINGGFIKARDVPQAERIKIKAEPVYSICTNKGGPILVNGLGVLSNKYIKWLFDDMKKTTTNPESQPK